MTELEFRSRQCGCVLTLLASFDIVSVFGPYSACQSSGKDQLRRKDQPKAIPDEYRYSSAAEPATRNRSKTAR
jgi:hypothetical protein